MTLIFFDLSSNLPKMPKAKILTSIQHGMHIVISSKNPRNLQSIEIIKVTKYVYLGF